MEIKCGQCGSIIKGFNEDCKECLRRENESKK